MNPSETDRVTIGALAAADLGDVVAIDAAIEGRPRRAYVERRLAAALSEPALHAQFAARGDDGLVGYLLARVLAGEFGRSQPTLRLEMVGVRGQARGHGIGGRLFDALVQWGRRHGIGQVTTAAAWRDATMLHWLDSTGFSLAPELVIDCALGGAEAAVQADPDTTLASGREIDFGAPQANDFERLARDCADVRAMQPADLAEIVRIDRSITGRDRSDYITARLGEAMHNSAIRVSLTARRDGAVVGYLMARADLGDFGRTEPVAVLDTIGVDAGYAHQGVARALLSQLFANLGALRIERIETVVAAADPALLGFFLRAGFAPSQRLSFVRSLGAAL